MRQLIIFIEQNNVFIANRKRLFKQTKFGQKQNSGEMNVEKRGKY